MRGEPGTVERVELRRGEEPERIPPDPPDIANTGGAIQNDVVDALPLQVIADRQPSLACPDHHNIVVFALGVDRLSRRCCRECIGLGSEQIARLDQIRRMAAGMGPADGRRCRA
jgi:hypothetical protein